ncbi:glycosyltransferase family 2 protein [Galbibacter orientalis]|uniref:glycosyltransferase family 2 protein n=1 Tax=Galbibacter orientalis TaxID=453852 RepID=UPI0030806BFB
MENSFEVSIITPVYNSSSFLKDNIESLQKQTFKNYEHILIDDCSSDSSVEMIENYAKIDNRIKLIRLDKNSGAGVARNTGIKAAIGRYISFLDADDYWHASKLERQIKFMSEMDCAFSYTQYYIVEGNEEKPSYIVKSPSKINYNDILKNCYVGCLTAMYDTQKIGKFYMPKIRKRQDWVLWIKILEKTNVAYGIQEPLAYYRVGNESLSNNKFKLIKYNFSVYHEVLKMGYLTSVYRMVLFLFHYFKFKTFSKKSL